MALDHRRSYVFLERGVGVMGCLPKDGKDLHFMFESLGTKKKNII